MDLDKLSKQIVEAATANLRLWGEVLPVVLIFKDGRPMIPLTVRIPEGADHRQVYAPTREYIESIKPDAVFTVNEAWVAEGEDTGVRPVDRPDRKEAISVVMMVKDVGTKGWLVKFYRTEKTGSNPHGIGRMELVSLDSVTTSLIDPWWEQPPPLHDACGERRRMS